MGSQKGEFGHDQASRLQDSRRGNERTLRAILANSEMIKHALFHLLVRTHIIMANLDALEAEVSEISGTVDSAIALIAGLRQAIIDAGTDPVKLAKLVADLNTKQEALAAAVEENPGSTGGV